MAGLLAEILAHAADIVKTTVGARTVEGLAAKWAGMSPRKAGIGARVRGQNVVDPGQR